MIFVFEESSSRIYVGTFTKLLKHERRINNMYDVVSRKIVIQKNILRLSILFQLPLKLFQPNEIHFHLLRFYVLDFFLYVSL